MKLAAGVVIALMAALLGCIGSREGPRGMLVLPAMFLAAIAVALMS